MQNKSLFIGIAVVLFVISGVVGYFGPPAYERYRHEQRRAAFIPPGVPKSKLDAFARHFSTLSPSIEPETLPDDAFTDTKGKKVRFSDFAGKPTLVNFWATWCLPCIVELPSLDRMAEHYKDRMNVIAVALEPNKTAEDIAEFLENRELGGFAGYLDDTDVIGKKLALRGIPTTYLIGSDGTILYRFEGDADWLSADSKVSSTRFFCTKDELFLKYFKGIITDNGNNA